MLYPCCFYGSCPEGQHKLVWLTHMQRVNSTHDYNLTQDTMQSHKESTMTLYLGLRSKGDPKARGQVEMVVATGNTQNPAISSVIIINQVSDNGQLQPGAPFSVYFIPVVLRFSTPTPSSSSSSHSSSSSFHRRGWWKSHKMKCEGAPTTENCWSTPAQPGSHVSHAIPGKVLGAIEFQTFPTRVVCVSASTQGGGQIINKKRWSVSLII